MPWTPKDALRHTKKATSAKAQRQWSDVSNSALSRGASEGSAIRQANAVVGRRKYADGGEVPRGSSSPGTPGVSGAVRDAIAALRDYAIDRPRREIQAAKEQRENSIIDDTAPTIPAQTNYAAGGPISPLAAQVGNPMQMRSTLPKLGNANPMGMGHMRMPHVPLGGTLHNIDQHMAGARMKLPSLKAAVGGAISPQQLPLQAIAAVKQAISHLANKDASSAAATLRSSPEAMRHPTVRHAEHALRTSQRLAPANQGLAQVASTEQPLTGQ